MNGPPTTAFALPGWRGEVVSAWYPTDLAEAIRLATDADAAGRTLHRDRNHIYVVRWPRAGGPAEVAVKWFGRFDQDPDWQKYFQVSKAERAFQMAHEVLAIGLLTPQPVAMIESTEPGGPSCYVSLLHPHTSNIGPFLRAVNQGRETVEFPGVDPSLFIRALGGMIHRLHRGRIRHNDLSNTNVLVRYPVEGGEPEFCLLDLNRARSGHPIGLRDGLRELCRLQIRHLKYQKDYLQGYLDRPPRWFERILYTYYRTRIQRSRRKRRLIRRTERGR